MENAKKIAVILSVYKNDKLPAFRKCVDSLLGQTYPGRIDLWIQFDGCVETEIESFLESINRGNIFISKRDENRGLAFSLNELLVKVLREDYEYIARMDADDISMANRFLLQTRYLETYSDVDICGGFIEEMDEQENNMMSVSYPLNHNEMRLLFGRRNPLAHVTTMFRRSFFEKAGLYPVDTDKDEDTIFWLNGFLHGCRFGNIDQVCVRVRVCNDFYKRRSGFSKSYGDFKNRCRVIKELKLPLKNYLFAFVRFLIFMVPVPAVTYWAYKLLRN